MEMELHTSHREVCNIISSFHQVYQVCCHEVFSVIQSNLVLRPGPKVFFELSFIDAIRMLVFCIIIIYFFEAIDVLKITSVQGDWGLFFSSFNHGPASSIPVRAMVVVSKRRVAL